jgi:hypothetical protein
MPFRCPRSLHREHCFNAGLPRLHVAKGMQEALDEQGLGEAVLDGRSSVRPKTSLLSVGKRQNIVDALRELLGGGCVEA